MPDQQQTQPTLPARRQHFRRVRDGVPVEYSLETCQPVQSRYAHCNHCEQACPVGAVQVGPGGIEVAATCVGCGQCDAACPTGALGVVGFALPRLEPAPDVPLFVDCWKVPAEHSPKGAVRVPCLGGLSQSRLLDLRVAAGTRRVVLLDRGWCVQCPAGAGDEHPATECVNAVGELLDAMRFAPDQWPAIEVRPLAATQASSVQPDYRREQRLSRREFFGGLVAQITDTASELNPLTSGQQPPIARGHERVPVRSRERDRLLAQVRTLAERTGSAVPASLYPKVHIDAQHCGHHRLCAATCPTGALVSFGVSGVSGIVFDSSACIACGHCETICPEQALTLLPKGDGQVPVGPKTLVHIRQRDCGGCGRPFEGADVEEHCPACRKRTALAGAAFHTLFSRPG